MTYKDLKLRKWYKREHYLDNKEEYAWRRNLWRALNPEKIARIRRNYYERTKEKDRIRHKVWTKNNPEKAKQGNKRQWERRKNYYNCIKRLRYKFKKMYGDVQK